MVLSTSLKLICVTIADTMKRIYPLIIILSTIIALTGSEVFPDAAVHPLSKEERDFYVSSIMPALAAVQKSMPPAPHGWAVAGETKISAEPPVRVSADIAGFHFAYLITYKRMDGVKEEQRRLDELYAASSGKNREAAKLQIDELIQQQTDTSLALRKATRRRNQREMDRLNAELDENGSKMRAIHEDIDRKIAKDVEPYLLKDAEASILVSINDTSAELPEAGSLAFPGAAFALRREGARSGITSWREGQTMILFGGWEQEKQNRFRTKTDQPLFSPKARTVRIVVTGDRKRTEELMGLIDIGAILRLMK